MGKILKKTKIIGKLGYTISCLLNKTLDIKIISHSDYDPNKPYLFAFWHGRQWLPVMYLVKHNTPNCALVSASRDGDMLSYWLQALGYTVLRGSSRHGNIKSLVAMKKKLEQGFSVGFGIDGPIGPIYEVKPGMSYLARKLQIPIVPIGSAFSRKWIFAKAWDKYQLPKPFAKAVYYLGKPLLVPNTADLDEYNNKLTNQLHSAGSKASEAL